MSDFKNAKLNNMILIHYCCYRYYIRKHTDKIELRQEVKCFDTEMDNRAKYVPDFSDVKIIKHILNFYRTINLKLN